MSGEAIKVDETLPTHRYVVALMTAELPLMNESALVARKFHRIERMRCRKEHFTSIISHIFSRKLSYIEIFSENDLTQNLLNVDKAKHCA